ncbi:MAG: alpha/beta hydrolase [Rhodobacterales bacterium]
MTDWDDAFDNMGHVPNALSYMDAWQGQAKAFRESGVKADLALAYGQEPRQKLDIFWPDNVPKGLVVFMHGGYWIKLDRSYFSHLAAGPVANGWAVAIPSYTLAPKAKISNMTRETAQAIACAADKIAGPICVTGHSAGGHLATRMVCENSPLDRRLQKRIVKTLSISGLHDLRNLLKTKLNDALNLTSPEAALESPCLSVPIKAANVTCWVGRNERPEFMRQSQHLCDVWGKHGAKTDVVMVEGKHHFTIIDDLSSPHSHLTRTLLGLNNDTSGYDETGR